MFESHGGLEFVDNDQYPNAADCLYMVLTILPGRTGLVLTVNGHQVVQGPGGPVLADRSNALRQQTKDWLEGPGQERPLLEFEGPTVRHSLITEQKVRRGYACLRAGPVLPTPSLKVTNQSSVLSRAGGLDHMFIIQSNVLYSDLSTCQVVKTYPNPTLEARGVTHSTRLHRQRTPVGVPPLTRAPCYSRLKSECHRPAGRPRHL